MFSTGNHRQGTADNQYVELRNLMHYNIYSSIPRTTGWGPVPYRPALTHYDVHFTKQMHKLVWTEKACCDP
jgi:hypothetical protein